MRRKHLELISPSSPNTTSQPSTKQRLSFAALSEPTAAGTFADTHFGKSHNSEATENYKQWEPQAIWNPWTSLSPENNIKTTKALPYTISTRFNATSLSFEQSNGGINIKNIEFDKFNNNTGGVEFLIPFSDYIQLTPQSESDQEDSDSAQNLLSDSIHESLSPIPQTLLCDEQITYEYSSDGKLVGGSIDACWRDIPEINMEPSTSRHALERLSALQNTIWMARPNIVLSNTDILKPSIRKIGFNKALKIERPALEVRRSMLGLNVLKIPIV